MDIVLGGGAVQALPYAVWPHREGLRACMPGRSIIAQPDHVIEQWMDQLRIGAAEALGAHTISAFDELSFTLSFPLANSSTAAGSPSLSTPVVRGMAFVSGRYDRITPRLRLYGGISRLNDVRREDGASIAANGTRFLVTLASGDEWRVYASSMLELIASDAELQSARPWSGWVRAALVTSPAGSTILDAHSHRVPLGGAVGAASDGDLVETRIQWRADGGGQLLMMALPSHTHELVVDGSSLGANPPANVTRAAALTAPTLKGMMSAVIGEVWALRRPLPHVGWGAGRPIDPSRVLPIRDAVRSALAPRTAPEPRTGTRALTRFRGSLIVSHRTAHRHARALTLSGFADRLTQLRSELNSGDSHYPTDPYWGGKAMSRTARLVLIADELNETDASRRLRARLAEALEPWLNGTNPDPLLHDTLWGGVVFASGVANSGAGYGAGYYNDQHFQVPATNDDAIHAFLLSRVPGGDFGEFAADFGHCWGWSGKFGGGAQFAHDIGRSAVAV